MEDAVEEAKTESGLVLMDTKSLDASKVELSVVSAVNGKEEADNLVMIMDYCKGPAGGLASPAEQGGYEERRLPL